MAVIRIDVEIDSEVYPELYARLTGIQRSSSREERLRQLAASGLVWELVRLSDAANSRKPATAPVRPAVSPGLGGPSQQRGRAGSARSQDVPVLEDAVEAVSAAKVPDSDRPNVVELRKEDRAGPDDAADAPPLPPPLMTEVHAPAARSARVRRMLDRGLFKNG